MRRVFGKVSAGCVLNKPLCHAHSKICNFKEAAIVALHFVLFAAHFFLSAIETSLNQWHLFVCSKTIAKAARTLYRCYEILPLLLLPLFALLLGPHSPSPTVPSSDPLFCVPLAWHYMLLQISWRILLYEAIVSTSIRRKRCIDFCSFWICSLVCSPACLSP